LSPSTYTRPTRFIPFITLKETQQINATEKKRKERRKKQQKATDCIYLLFQSKATEKEKIKIKKMWTRGRSL